MKLPPDWSEFFALLQSHRVRFLVVGAHALAANGRPRATADLDILVEPTSENAQRLGNALSDFGFPALANAADRFAEPDRMASLGNPPLRIDIMTSISGVTFDEAWADRLEGSLETHSIPFLGVRSFVKNKRASGRPKDLLDIELLREAGLLDSTEE